MSKKFRFGEHFDKQHFESAKAVPKSSSQHFYAIDSSLPGQLSWKKSLLMTCQILSLLANTLAANENYPVLNRDNLTIPIQMQFSQKQNTFSYFFAAFLKCAINFKYFVKRDNPHIFVFPKLRTPNIWLDKCLKSPVSENPSTSNMVNVPKHC